MVAKFWKWFNLFSLFISGWNLGCGVVALVQGRWWQAVLNLSVGGVLLFITWSNRSYRGPSPVVDRKLVAALRLKLGADNTGYMNRFADTRMQNSTPPTDGMQNSPPPTDEEKAQQARDQQNTAWPGHDSTWGHE